MTAPSEPQTPNLSRFKDALALSHVPARLEAFIEAYEFSRGDAVAPRRADLDMRRLSAFLPDISIMERVAPGKLIYRLLGTGVVERLGADLTGHNFMDYIRNVDGEAIDAGMTGVIEQPCGTLLLYENVYASGKRSRVETLAMPLDSGTGKPPYLFMGLHTVQDTLSYQETRQETIIGADWTDGVIIDLGYGLPDTKFLDDLKRKP